jgi:hypothetical protein
MRPAERERLHVMRLDLLGRSADGAAVPVLRERAAAERVLLAPEPRAVERRFVTGAPDDRYDPGG